jgi:D-sedoheptulose 7-phosphate isomerase
MTKNAREYLKTLKNLFDKIVITDSDGQLYRLEEAIDRSIHMIVNQATTGGKLLFIGNGASASISSHIATDFWKNGGIKAIAFNDSSLITCISNDYGYKYVFEKAISMFADREDILIAISSSGQSENILRAASTAKKKKLHVITLSGFDEDNPLRKLGDINFYVPALQYGYVEVVHLSICHCLVDTVIDRKKL